MEREKVQKYYSITFNQRETSDDGVHNVLTRLLLYILPRKKRERVKSFLHKVP